MNQGAGWMRLSRAAMIRNENSRHTLIELAIHKLDLLGSDHADRWAEGLQFGFSFAMNDGDSVARQRGWAGYYPAAVVKDWNGGQKSPSKAGVARLADQGRPLRSAPTGGGGGGAPFFGLFDLICLLALIAAALAVAFSRWRRGGMDALLELVPEALRDRMGRTGRAQTGPSSTPTQALASADFAAYTAPVVSVQPVVGSTA